jgi:protocatechuate 4,5-dioxygenase alpha subunit
MDQMIAGTPVFTGERAHHGYRLNRLAMSLTDPVNRQRFVADELGYARELGLEEVEVEMVRQRDWKAMNDAGCSIYLLIKIAGSLGQNLLQVGAHTSGQTLEQFMANRKGH